MESKELLRAVRKIEIKSKLISNQVFSGEYHSAFKGKGMTFSEVREYQYGDPIKDIDWHVTARFNHPFVKVYEEERELTTMLLIDISGSEQFGTQQKFKQSLCTEIAAVLSFSAIQNNDKVGAILFSNKIEKFIPPKKGKKHILRIILELLNFKPENKQTDVNEALKYLTNVTKKKCIAFIISDFCSPNFSEALKIASRKHDIIALRVYDKFEVQIPDIGLALFRDAETNDLKWVDTSSKKTRNDYNQYWENHLEELDKIFKMAKVNWTSIRTDQDFVSPLIKLFKSR